MLSVQSLSKSFGAHKAVDSVSFSVGGGELVALIGPNGAGKTTTFNMINGQLQASSGQIRFNGHDLRGLPPRKIARLGVGRTFQVAATFASQTVLENVQMALLAHHRRLYRFWSAASAQYAEQASALLDQTGMLSQSHRPCSELAYGDVKRVELAMALASQPELLLMDEPTAGMAPAERRALMLLVQKLAQERNMAVLFTEHSMDVVFAHASRIVVLARGRVVADDRPDAVRANPQVQQVYFGSGAADKPVADAARGAHDVADVQDRNTALRADTPVLLSAENLNAWYGDAQILFDVTMQLRRGEVVALMGRNGAGKSTTLKTIMGMLARRTGQVRFMGTAIQHLALHQIAKMGLGYVPEERRIFTDLTVMENLHAGRQPLRHQGEGGAAPSWSTQDLFRYFPNLEPMAHRRGDQMSGGEQQMLAVARTLMGNPYVVLLDEPSEGVAPIIVNAMAEMIRVLKQRGVSVVLCEQNMEFAAGVADRVYVLEKGQIQYDGAMQDLAQDHDTRRRLLSV